MSTVTLLGPQFRDPNLGEVLQILGLRGPFVSISAGWQEREGEIDELRNHVGEEVQDLGIYALTEEVFSADRELRLAHRARQATLQDMQELYALQLGHAKEAARALFARHEGNIEILRASRRHAVRSLRRLDRAHLTAIKRVHEDFEKRMQPATRPALRHALQLLAPRLQAASAVFIAGGHVAALANRLRMLGGAALLGDRPVVAWSAGAMVLGESIVLFHDQPPQGAANAELFDAGFGMVRDVVPLPHAQTRLRLHDTARVALMARRFAPASCLTLDPGACLQFVDGRLRYHSGSFQLSRQGHLSEIASRAVPVGVR